MNRGWLDFLGLVFSAGAVITGEEFVIKAIKNQKVCLVILSEDISYNTFKRVTDKCRSYRVEYVQKATSDEIGKAIGKTFRKVIGVTDKNLATTLKNKMNK